MNTRERIEKKLKLMEKYCKDKNYKMAIKMNKEINKLWLKVGNK